MSDIQNFIVNVEGDLSEAEQAAVTVLKNDAANLLTAVGSPLVQAIIKALETLGEDALVALLGSSTGNAPDTSNASLPTPPAS